MGPPSLDCRVGQEHPLAPEAKAVEAFKKVTVLALGAAMERYGRALQDEQEVLLWIADLAIDTYASESALARTMTAEAITPSTIGLHLAAARTFISDAALRVETTARQILAAIAEGDTLRTHLAALRRVLKVLPADTVRCRRVLADATVERGGYCSRSRMTADGLRINTDQSRHESTGQTRISRITEMNSLFRFVRVDP